MLHLLAMAALAAPRPAPSAPAPDPTQPAGWICRPGADDPCAAQPLAEWLPDGTLARSRFAPDASAPVDCFYVYPTVDLRIRVGNDLDLVDQADAERVTRAQAALLGQVCRVWAPHYRQVTLGTYFVGAKRAGPYFDTAWGDVSRAFDAFLAEIGPDRGFVLVGHSQGGQQVTRLVRERVERDSALRKRLVAAYPIGWRTATASGARLGGSFRDVPVCAGPDDTGCAVAFRSFAAGGPPARRTDAYTEGDALVCVNPAAPGTMDHARLAGTVLLPSNTHPVRPPGYDADVDGLLVVRDAWQARCVKTPDGAALEVRWSPNSGDLRPDVLEVDHGRWSTPVGTHVLDVQLTLLDVVADVKRRAAAWLTGQG